ncbi:NAD-dependent epimerase/dehydratase family protein [Labedella phragmitis]|uniref:NAD-dependent epimerase/dehydratase family protein n=3 Tax=Labedella TaxID=390250 RepID=A0A444Q0Y0_9MICO|nr:NAD-dependent epimerase/dehydratase family protein [Labedella phragmitis]RWZ46067.1 NAD-dependent epimerase/dehydratase family protein [Labedella phragmitis]RWZ54837.1 NAD-dependent epimerase/dehydratase family protein [Labedella populi]
MSLEDVVNAGTQAHRTVLVTGGTGYLAGWLLVRLLEQGYAARATVRDPARRTQVRAALAQHVGEDRASSVEFVTADLLAEEGWDDAVAGVDYVLHAASPLGFSGGEDLIRIAREGAARVLSAAARSGVKRAVLTSSAVAAISDDPRPYGVETVWAAPSGTPARRYNDSKIFAERDAWRLANETGLELSTVLPTFMQGPPPGAPSKEGSVELVRRLLTGGLPAVPRIGWDVVDVRDIATLHLLSMTSPLAAGERFIGSGDWLWWRDMARILREKAPEISRKVPTKNMPDTVVKMLGRFNPQMASLRLNLGKQTSVDGSKARNILDWHPRPAEETVLDTAAALAAMPRLDADQASSSKAAR